MRVSCLIVALASVFLVLIVHAPNVQAKAITDTDTDADANANDDALIVAGIVSIN